MAQLMLMPLTVSCFSKIQIGFTFLVPAGPGIPGQGAVKGVFFRLLVKYYQLQLTDDGPVYHALSVHLS